MLDLSVSAGGTGARGLELRESSVTGTLAADGNSVEFKLSGFARSEREGSAVELLGGGAALSGAVAGVEI